MNLHRYRVVLLSGALAALAAAAADVLPAGDALRLQRAAADLEKEGGFKEAGKLYRHLLRHTADPEQKASYLLHQAECSLFAGRLQDAREGFELLLKKYPYYLPYDRVLARLRQLAAAYEEGKGTFLGFRDVDAALNIYRLILAEHASFKDSLPDRLKFAELLLGTGAREEAAGVYFEVLRRLPEDNDVRYRYIRLLSRIAGDGDGDGSVLRAVRREIRVFLAKAPAEDARREEIVRLSAECEEIAAGRIMVQARFYLLKHYRRPEIARRYLHDIVRGFPETAVAREARSMLQREFGDGPQE